MPEAVIVSAARTPIGRANKGSLKDFRPDDLSALIIKSALEKIPALDPNTIDDLYLGCGLPGGEMGNNMGRIVSVLMGYDKIPGATITRYCSSSVQTTRMAFHAIKAGEGDAFISAGVETVSRFAKGTSDHIPGTRNELFNDGAARTAKYAEGGQDWHDPREDGLLPDAYIQMGQTAENVARMLKLDRQELDEFGVRSQNLTEAAIASLGGVDVLVNNAGILLFSPLLEITVDDWDRTFDVNVRSMLLTTQVVAKAMIAAGSPGAIVNMASMGGKVGSPNQAHYAASKAAVISLTRVSAMELGEHGIRVNCICPGYVLTEMGAATRTPEMVAKWSSLSPLGRCAEPQEVADMALFLASDQGRYCTGQAMNVTGGMVMH